MRSLARELDAARRAARKAGEIALGYFERPIEVETKPDDSPVTAADRAAERLIAAELSEAFPDDGLLGEEGAARDARSGRRWIIDPIDGTRDFLRGIPAWAVLIALEDAGEVVAGVVHLPALRQTCFASAGGGAFLDGTPIHASTVAGPARAVLCVDGLNYLHRYPFAGRLVEWMAPFWNVRSLGGCLDAVMVARGLADLWIEATGKPWDFAPLRVIAEEAGARFFDFTGRATIYGGNGIVAAPGLEAAARSLLAMRC